MVTMPTTNRESELLLLPGEIKHDMSMVVTGRIIFTCQLSPSMALFTLESRKDLIKEQPTESARSINPWNDGEGKYDCEENLQYLDVILKRNDGWQNELIGAIHQLLEQTLLEEQEEDAYSQGLKARKNIRVGGFLERMRPKFDGDTSPVCLHAQTIHVGDTSKFEVTKTERLAVEKTPAKNDASKQQETKPAIGAREPKNIDKGKHGGVDDNTRFSKFVHFLLSEFGGYETLSQKPVLDIAGGAGGLAFELCMRHEIQAIVVDTKQVKLKGQQVRFLKFRKYCLEQLAKDPHGTAHKSLLKHNLQNRFRTRDFVQLNALLDSSSILPAKENAMLCPGDRPYSETDQQLQSILKNKECSVMVGLHPDQATDPIVDIGLALGIPWAIVPCCVFPNLYTRRELTNGQPVRNYEDLCDYIQQKDPNIQKAEIPCQGRNTVLYWHPPGLSERFNLTS